MQLTYLTCNTLNHIFRRIRIQQIRCTEDIIVLRNLDEIHKRKYR